MPARHVAPSILSADFARLGAHVDEVIAAGAHIIHVDVMDGHFVPPITIGPIIVSALREHVGPDIDLDVHLMIERPEKHVADFASAGATGITIHAEATPHVLYALDAVREGGCRAGLAVCPATPLTVFEEVAVDQALCMTVNPGWGGQPFIPTSPDKIRRLRALVGPDVPLMVDGGVSVKTAAACVEAGADWLVAGSAVFGTDDPGEAFRAIVAAAAG
ncbi:ribulose-phosphate 3-epimerase [Paraconexibacter antarcticus]|uniref:Ribulose-phosphate 3-epimerase n=1 Tax=Paraconexibacter antarcticus TaxID=2949664 RepID=A0ABY5DMC3_9ACTN|nr:ribulose-phosphate 3-epimerase [Paraconexibacter antarcticus]UTI63128.1 ribulose-phosphate 3-epimerase [Paraconexibacter antarcticus]